MGAQTSAGDGPVWQALADPTRRRILDLLRQRPRITGEVAANFRLSRIAVMRHLQVLADAGLVTSRKRGRERWHYLNALPMEDLFERWVDPHARGWVAGLRRLRIGTEQRAAHMTGDHAVVDVAIDVPIAATPAQVFDALTKDPAAWWGHPYLRADATGLELEDRLGGGLVETWDAGGALLATVTGWKENRYLQLTGPFHLGLALGIAAFELVPRKSETALMFSFRAIGAIEPETVEQFKQGWAELVARRLKTFVETGTRLGIAPDPQNKE